MLSRVADSLYWMARYIERAENLARLLLAHQHLRLDADLSSGNEDTFWRPLLMTTGDEEAYFDMHDRVDGPTVYQFISMQKENPNSIRNCLRAARENARMVRDQLADELWECLNDLYLHASAGNAAQQSEMEPTAFCEQVLRGSYLFQGIARATMPRQEGWCFVQMGTYLERADKTSRLVDACSAVPLEMPPHPDAQPLRWTALLHSSSGYQTFHERSPMLDPVRIIEFLLLDASFPRSVRFCVTEVARTLDVLKRNSSIPPGSQDPFRVSGMLRSDLEYALVSEILESGLHRYIDTIQLRLNTMGEAIFQMFVLYPDLLQASAEEAAISPATAWHTRDDEEIQQQQQQQQ